MVLLSSFLLVPGQEQRYRLIHSEQIKMRIASELSFKKQRLRNPTRTKSSAETLHVKRKKQKSASKNWVLASTDIRTKRINKEVA